jgi:hypothetical protein
MIEKEASDASLQKLLDLQRQTVVFGRNVVGTCRGACPARVSPVNLVSLSHWPTAGGASPQDGI